VIVSHKHRFIFLKTARTAGSSIEVALQPFLGPDDIIGGRNWKPWVPGKAKRGRNHLRGLARAGIYVPRGISRFVPQLSGFYPHMPARQVRTLIGDEIWNSYFKFSIERNPWDRQVSQFFYRHRRRSGESLTFELHITSWWYRATNSVVMDNWGVYTADNSIAVDRVLRFENLAQDFSEVCSRLGLEGAILPHINMSSKRDRPYRDFYNERTKAVVGGWYRREIEAFGYEF
jgi:hypothetical protein